MDAGISSTRALVGVMGDWCVRRTWGVPAGAMLTPPTVGSDGVGGHVEAVWTGPVPDAPPPDTLNCLVAGPLRRWNGVLCLRPSGLLVSFACCCFCLNDLTYQTGKIHYTHEPIPRGDYNQCPTHFALTKITASIVPTYWHQASLDNSIINRHWVSAHYWQYFIRLAATFTLWQGLVAHLTAATVRASVRLCKWPGENIFICPLAIKQTIVGGFCDNFRQPIITEFAIKPLGLGAFRILLRGLCCENKLTRVFHSNMT